MEDLQKLETKHEMDKNNLTALCEKTLKSHDTTTAKHEEELEAFLSTPLDSNHQ